MRLILLTDCEDRTEKICLEGESREKTIPKFLMATARMNARLEYEKREKTHISWTSEIPEKKGVRGRFVTKFVAEHVYTFLGLI